jgi:predicted RNase H-like HicB family nuclease
MLQYRVEIEWSDDDRAFVARAPELEGCMAHGSSYEEAVRNIQDAMAAWLEFVRDLGQDVPEPAWKAAKAG